MVTRSAHTLPKIRETEPKTEWEAEEVAAQLERATVEEDPGPAEILSYRVLPLPTMETLRPNLPCEGPPFIPRFMNVLWPDAVRDPIYRSYKKEGKPHRQMELDYLPDSLPEVHVYVLKRKMEGDYKVKLQNISKEIDIPGTGKLQTTLDTAEEQAQARLMDAVEVANESIPKEAVRDLVMGFMFEGTWALIKAVWEYLTTRKITVKLAVPTRIPGYETDDWIVDEFSKEFSVEARIPVDNIRWHAW